jgi:hypothetical protein
LIIAILAARFDWAANGLQKYLHFYVFLDIFCLPFLDKNIARTTLISTYFNSIFHY